MSSERVLITGGAGFIGSHLVADLVHLGCTVTVVDDLSTGSLDNLTNSFSYIDMLTMDVRKLAPEKLGEFDVIFHLAGTAYVPQSVKAPVADCVRNVEVTLLLLEKVRATMPRPKLIYASSAAVYGSPKELPITEETPVDPVSPYGVSKLAAERYVALYNRIYGLPTASLRLFSVYGPRQRKQVVYDLIQKVTSDPLKVTVIGDGTQTRDFVYVGDVVKAFWRVARYAPCNGEVYNVASGTSVSISELLDTICLACEAVPKRDYTGSVRKGDADRWEASIDRIRGLLYEPSFDLEAGIRATVRWFDAQQPVSRAAAS